MNILNKVEEIMVNRSSEKDRQYGPFAESIERAAIIATQMTGLEIGPKEFMKCMIALKLSRMRYNLKEDTMMDGIAYIFGLSEYERECEKQVADFDKLLYKAPSGEETQIITKPFEALSDGEKLAYLNIRYKSGTKFKSPQSGLTCISNGEISKYLDQFITNGFYVYYDGKLAEIIE